jgi:putative inorganic carbon (HCO3(-)) transporter
MSTVSTPTAPEQALPLYRQWWFWLGISIGLVVVFVAEQELKWFGVLVAGLLVGFVSLAFADKKDFFLLLLVASLPINLGIRLAYQPSDLSRSTYGLQVLLFFLPLAALYIIWGLRATGRQPTGALATTGLLPLALLFFSVSISVWRSVNPLFGLFDLFSLFWSLLLFLYVASQVGSRRELRLVVAVLALNVGFQGTIALAQHLTNSTLGLDFFGATTKLRDYLSLAALSRAGGTLGHPNSLALFFDLLLPLVFSLLFVPQRHLRRLGWGVLLLLGLLGLVVTQSRGGMVATGLILTLLLLLHLARRAGWSAALVFVALFLTVVGVGIFTTGNPISKRFLRHDYGTAYGRVPHLRVASNLIRAYPVFGVGLNVYTEVAPRFDDTPQQIIAQWQAPVHHLYAFIMAEIGLSGFFWLLLFWLAVIRGVWPAVRSADPFLSSVGLGLLGGLLAFFVHGQFDYALWTHFTVLWFVCGLMVATGRLAQAETHPPATQLP